MTGQERSLATRAAWLSYVGGLTQEEIAARLSLSRVKVARLIAAAQRAGLIRVFVDGQVVECLTLERQIASRFGLAWCTVAPEFDEADLPLRALGSAGASWLQRRLDQGGHQVVGFGHGRTLAAVVEQLPRSPRPGLQVVSLLGSLTRRAAAHPFDVIHRMAETTGAEAYFLPAPFFADTVEDKQVLTAQKSIDQVLALARTASLHVIGIGEVGPQAQLAVTGMVRSDEYAQAHRAGAVGEVLGRFVDVRGAPVDAEINSRTIALSLDELRGKEVVAIAGGKSKVEAIAAVLRGGAITALITDEATARSLIDTVPVPDAPTVEVAIVA